MPGNTRRAAKRAHAAGGSPQRHGRPGRSERRRSSNGPYLSDEERVRNFTAKIHTAISDGGREGFFVRWAMPSPLGWGNHSTSQAWEDFSGWEEPRQLQATLRWREWLSSDWMEDPENGNATQRRIRDIIVTETSFEAGE